MALDSKLIAAARRRKVGSKDMQGANPSALTPVANPKPLLELQPGASIPVQSDGQGRLGQHLGPTKEEQEANFYAKETPEERKQRRMDKIATEAARSRKQGTGSESLNEMAAGLGAANKIATSLGLTDLGRINEAPSAASQESLANASELAKGYSSKELAAQQSSALEATANTSQAAERRLKAMQASQGMKGGAAASQQMGLLQQGVQARANIERDLIMGQFQAQLQGNQQLSSIQQNQDATKREAEQFNLTQASREKMMPLQIAQGAQTADAIKQAGIIQADATRAAGGSSGKIICTELHRQGFLPDDIMDLDAAFGKAQSKRVMKGYHFLAKPLVRLMKKSSIITHLTAILAIPWAKHMAHLMEPHREDSIVGEIVMNIGYPLCKFTGMILSKLGK